MRPSDAPAHDFRIGAGPPEAEDPGRIAHRTVRDGDPAARVWWPRPVRSQDPPAAPAFNSTGRAGPGDRPKSSRNSSNSHGNRQTRRHPVATEAVEEVWRSTSAVQVETNAAPDPCRWHHRSQSEGGSPIPSTTRGHDPDDSGMPVVGPEDERRVLPGSKLSATGPRTSSGSAVNSAARHCGLPADRPDGRLPPGHRSAKLQPVVGISTRPAALSRGAGMNPTCRPEPALPLQAGTGRARTPGQRLCPATGGRGERIRFSPPTATSATVASATRSRSGAQSFRGQVPSPAPAPTDDPGAAEHPRPGDLPAAGRSLPGAGQRRSRQVVIGDDDIATRRLSWSTAC